MQLKLHEGDTRSVREMMTQTLIWHGGHAARMSIFSAATLREWVGGGGSAVVYDPDGIIRALARGVGRTLELDLAQPHRSLGWNFLRAVKENRGLAGELSEAICHREPPDDPAFVPAEEARAFRKRQAFCALAALLGVACQSPAATPADLYRFVSKRSLAEMDETESGWAAALVRKGGGWDIISPSGLSFDRALKDLSFYLEPFGGEDALPLYSPDRRPFFPGAVREPCTALYVTPPEGALESCRPVVGAIFAHALYELAASPAGAPVLFVIPYKAEVPAPEIWNYAAVGRGRQLAMWLGFDGPEQLRAEEGEGAGRVLGYFNEQLVLAGPEFNERRRPLSAGEAGRPPLELPADESVRLLLEGARDSGKAGVHSSLSLAAESAGTPRLVIEVGDSTLVDVHIYSHPAWDSQLILKAEAGSREVARGYLGDGDDEKLLTRVETKMPRSEFERLSEFDG